MFSYSLGHDSISFRVLLPLEFLSFLLTRFMGCLWCSPSISLSVVAVHALPDSPHLPLILGLSFPTSFIKEGRFITLALEVELFLSRLHHFAYPPQGPRFLTVLGFFDFLSHCLSDVDIGGLPTKSFCCFHWVGNFMPYYICPIQVTLLSLTLPVRMWCSTCCWTGIWCSCLYVLSIPPGSLVSDSRSFIIPFVCQNHFPCIQVWRSYQILGHRFIAGGHWDVFSCWLGISLSPC